MKFNYTASEHVAKRILEECGLVHPAEVELGDIIFGRGAYYEEKPLKGKEGQIVCLGNRSIITVNSDIQFKSKKRFVAAHELGHHEMHRELAPVILESEDNLLSWYKGGRQEIEANEFASEFLMPSDIFYRRCASHKKFSPAVIDDLSQHFLVSKTVATLQFAKRGNHPVLLVYCDNNMMKWWKRSDDFRYYFRFERDKPPPSGSVVYEVFTKGKKYLGDEAIQQVWKSDWFELKDDERDKLIFEYCLYVPVYNYAISIIWED